MQKPTLPLRRTSALCALAITAAIPFVAHEATRTSDAGLPIVRLERVVVTPLSALAQTVAAAASKTHGSAMP